jgi:GNAT superfamily N-acetyltransferase
MIRSRPIVANDLPNLNKLYDELIGRPTNYSLMTDVYDTIKDNPNYIILGVFNEDDLVGSLMGIVCYDLVGECRPFMVLENVIVTDRARRQGIGKKLMLEIESIARARGCYYMIFVSGGQRAEAHEFYESLGFKEEKVEGYRKHFY